MIFKILDEKCKPSKGSEFAACVDLRSREDITIAPGETKLIPLGVKLDLEKLIQNALTYEYMAEDGGSKTWETYARARFKIRHYLQLDIRSSLRVAGLVAGTGIIDLDYKDEIMLVVHNISANNFSMSEEEVLEWSGCHTPDFTEIKEYKVEKGERVAQITLLEHKANLFGIETEEKRTGGLGSTGKE